MTSRLEVSDLTVRFGKVAAVNGVSLTVGAGTIAGLIGPNGAGKTSLLDAVSGLAPRSAGEILVDGVEVGRRPTHRRARMGVGRTFQTLELFEDLTVGENIAVAVEAQSRALARAGRNHVAVEVRHAAAVTGLGEHLGRVPTELSHGLRKRVALARAIAGRPKLLLLDEPAGGLDATERAGLLRTLLALAREGTTVLLVDHDLALVAECCAEVWVLDRGVLVSHGSPAQVRADPVVGTAYMGEALATATVGSPSRVNAEPEIVLRAEEVRAGYRGAPVLLGVDLEVGAGEIVGLLGANGAGKTTTLRALSGLLPISAGRATVLGQPVRTRPAELARRGLAHAPQDRGVMASLTVMENLRIAALFVDEGVERAIERLPALAGLAGRRAGTLSGGEQQLVALGRVVAARPRLALLDELSLGLAQGLFEQVAEVVVSLAREGAGVLLVEQHPHLALAVAGRAYVLQRGVVALQGPAADIADQPEALEAAYLG